VSRPHSSGSGRGTRSLPAGQPAAQPAVRDLSEGMAARGRRPTAQRLVVLEALRGAKRTVTAPELFDQLREDNPLIGRATVFRTLDSLVDAGLAQRFERPGHVYAYAACSSAHHHHLVCTVCNGDTELDVAILEPLAAELRRRYGFKSDLAHTAIVGVCRACQTRTDQ